MKHSKAQREYIRKLEKMDKYLFNVTNPVIPDMALRIKRELMSIDISKLGKYDRVRLKNLLKEARMIIKATFEIHEPRLRDHIVAKLIKDGEEYNKVWYSQMVGTTANTMYTAQIATGIRFVKPTYAYASIARKAIETYSPLLDIDGYNQMYKSLEKHLTKSLSRTINKLYLEGVTKLDNEVGKAIISRALLDDVISENKLKVLQSGGNTLYNTVISIGREEVRGKIEKDYSSHIKGFLYDAHLDTRTTQFCREHDERFYQCSTRAELHNKYNIQVPAHFNCRSVLIPIPKDDITPTV